MTGLWVHGVMERKEARAKLRIMTGPENAAGVSTAREEQREGS